jgi:hypothetical protein
MIDKLHELIDEFRTVVVGSSNLLDSILPPLIFVALNALLNLQAAIWGALIFVALVVTVRMVRRQSLHYALGGLGGVILAAAVAQLLGRAEGYFVPGIISSVATIFVALGSLIIRRPMVAWTSFIARRWPLAWYWHPRVRPAYSEVTLFWVLFFGLRSALQLAVLRTESVELLALTSFATGWPATIALLVVSYLYGTWRLKSLQGPSVEEFKNNAAPPWTSQRRGF